MLKIESRIFVTELFLCNRIKAKWIILPNYFLQRSKIGITSHLQTSFIWHLNLKIPLPNFHKCHSCVVICPVSHFVPYALPQKLSQQTFLYSCVGYTCTLLVYKAVPQRFYSWLKQQLSHSSSCSWYPFTTFR